MFSQGRITFEGNPWPDGHRLQGFAWTGRLLPRRGVTFELDLRSADYYENDADDFTEEDGEYLGDWKSKSVWGNYHSCIISSCEWGTSDGFLVGTAKKPIDLDELDGFDFHIDKLPISGEPTFATYLLGHDSVADHRITFKCSEKDDVETYDIGWRGKIALTYGGDTEYRHAFHAAISRVTFDGFRIPNGLDGKSAAHELGRYVVGGEDWTVDRRGGALWLLRPPTSEPRSVKPKAKAPAKKKTAAKKVAKRRAVRA